jgi:hypothetical protein
VCLYVCDQETPKREAKGPSWTIRACEKKSKYIIVFNKAHSQIGPHIEVRTTVLRCTQVANMYTVGCDGYRCPLTALPRKLLQIIPLSPKSLNSK